MYMRSVEPMVLKFSTGGVLSIADIMKVKSVVSEVTGGQNIK